MNKSLKVITRPEIQNMLDHFNICMNIRTLLYTRDGSILKVGKNMPDSSYCLLIRRLYGEHKCKVLDERMRDMATEVHDLICYTCHAGLNEVIEPIYIRGVLIGFAMIGQFRSDDIISETTLSDWKNKIGDPTNLIEAFMELPLYDNRKLDHIIAMFRMLVDYVLSKELISAEANVFIERIMKYLSDNIYKTFTLQSVAKEFGISTSTISHSIKLHTGKTFKHLYSELKIKEAEKIIREDPDVNIGELAEMLGFQDQFYFSKFYKKTTGMPPSEYKKRLQDSNS